MNCRGTCSVFYLTVFLLVVIIPACGLGPTGAEEEVSPDSSSSVVPEAAKTEPARQAPTQAEKAPTLPAEPSRGAEEPTTPTSGHHPAGPEPDKWALWVDGPHLRGANIYQRRVYPKLDGLEFMGAGPLGPPYTQEDFDRLAALGANYVNISHSGLFSETPPYTLDQEVQDNLDHLLDTVAQANMFAVISFRTGPGRAEFSVCCFEEPGDWYDESYLNPSNVAEGLVAPTAEIGEAGDSPGQPEKPVSVLPAGSVIDDFEGGDFDDRWWSYAGEGTRSFSCTLDQPGHASAQAMRLTFEVGADGYAGCGVDVDPGQWGEAGGLSFSWRADRPDLTVIVVLDMEDPTQINPEAEGVTPFEVEL
jgi:hypothetical protein